MLRMAHLVMMCSRTHAGAVVAYKTVNDDGGAQWQLGTLDSKVHKSKTAISTFDPHSLLFSRASL